MILKRGFIYDFWYDKSEEDPHPRVFIIESTEKKLVGLNIHYLQRWPNKNAPFHTYSNQQWDAIQANMVEGKHRRLFEFMNSELAKKIPASGIKQVITTRFKYALDFCLRNYEAHFIRNPVEYKIPQKLDEYTG